MFYSLQRPLHPQTFPPMMPPMMPQFQPTQQPGYWFYCPPPSMPMGAQFPGAVFPNSQFPPMYGQQQQQQTAPSYREQSKKECKLALVYKTELCRQFMDFGRCNYGDQCGYAHSEDELRQPPPRPPKFRTEVCSIFRQYGQCREGERCKFVHDDSALASLPSTTEGTMSDYLSSASSSSATSSPARLHDLDSSKERSWSSVRSFTDTHTNLQSSIAQEQKIVSLFAPFE